MVNPRRSRQRLPGHSFHTPYEARIHVHTTLLRWGAPRHVADDLRLIVSELTTNAVEHTRTQHVDVSVLMTDDEAAVVVVDRGPHCRPEPHQAGGEDEHGRGLAVVETLATRYVARPFGEGTAVWASITFADHSTPHEDQADAARTHP
ncbi:ATP-binding protein [Streptomyces sp. NPDC057199]|uniref:ATP-binding protein n=1 Tax=Streptomyces sp. NPDC057199 TaxID=3346047 RepID=UPI003641749A